jgi:TolA-binding protein
MGELQAKQLFDKLRAKVAKNDRANTGEVDERDEAISRLEREIEAERDNAVALRKTIDEQQFRIDVLEQSYSKQLDDARDRAEKAESALEAEKARSAELETLRDTLTAERDTAQRDLKRMTGREHASVSFGSPTASSAAAPVAAQSGFDQGASIDEILAEAHVVDPLDQARQRLVTNGPSAPEAPSDDEDLEDMLSPDAVFTGTDDD